MALGRVDTIIVNFKTKELTLAAAKSALAEPEANRVIVVDNASGDGSAEWLRSQLDPSWTEVVEAKENLGFGAGNNLGAWAATAEFIFLLNSDAYLLPGAFGALLPRFEEEEMGLVAPAVFLQDEITPQRDALGIFPTPFAVLSGKARRPIKSVTPDWVTGAGMMIRREEFLALGGFDERLFMYLEDVDLCKRLRDARRKIAIEPSAKLVHLGGGSVQSSARQKEQFRRSTDYYLEKHGFGVLGRFAVKAVRSLYARITRR